jgi:hypothetical protein
VVDKALVTGLRMRPPVALSGFESRRHGNLRVALWDTDFLLNQVRSSLHPSTSVQAGFLGLRLQQYASQHVFTELYGDDGHDHPTKWHKLSEQAMAAEAPPPQEAFRDAFESDFLPKITFVEMGDLFAGHPLAVGVRSVRNGKGASDVPTAQLAVLLSRLSPVAYSHDEHLYKSGVAPRPRHLSSVESAERQVAQAEHVQVGVAGVGAGAIVGIDYVARTVGGTLGSPPWLSRLLCLGAVAVMLRGPKRRQALGRVGVPLGRLLFEQIERSHEGLRFLDEHAVTVEASDTVEARVAEALTVSVRSSPLLAHEVQDALRTCDPTLVDVPTVRELRTVLSTTPCFEERPRWRYTLGHRYEQARHR